MSGATEAKYTLMVSHRSGETTDDFIRRPGWFPTVPIEK